MHWFIQITFERITYTLKAERLFINNQIEQIKITGEGVSIVLESNRPLLEDLQLNKEVTWKVIKGKLKDNAALKQVISALNESLKKTK
jgi:signal transduction protein with GAF and PtsI domain